MKFIFEDAPEDQSQDCFGCDEPCDLCNCLEQRILQKKQSFRRFPTVSAEEVLKWMEDFPQRKERFVAAVREGENCSGQPASDVPFSQRGRRRAKLYERE
jgi:hypothetical protein